MLIMSVYLPFYCPPVECCAEFYHAGALNAGWVVIQRGLLPYWWAAFSCIVKLMQIMCVALVFLVYIECVMVDMSKMALGEIRYLCV